LIKAISTAQWEPSGSVKSPKFNGFRAKSGDCGMDIDSIYPPNPIQRPVKVFSGKNYFQK